MRLARMVQMEFKEIMHHLRPVGPEGRQHWEVQQVVSEKPKELRSAVGQALGRNKPVGTLTYSTRIPVQRGDDGEPLVSLEAAAIRDHMLPQLQDQIEAARKRLEPPQLVPVYAPRRLAITNLSEGGSERVREVLRREFPALEVSDRPDLDILLPTGPIDRNYIRLVNRQLPRGAYMRFGNRPTMLLKQPVDGSEPVWPGFERPPYKATRLAEAQEVVEAATIIALWKKERIAEGTPPKDKAIKAKEMKVREMFGWLRENQGFTGGTDMAAVMLALLQAYKEHLIDLGVKEKKRTLVHDHLADITYLFDVADRNNKFANLPGGNPASKLHVPGKPKHIPTKKFTDNEARKILLSARHSDDLIIRWFHPLACFMGLITSEIVAIRKSEIVLVDGHWVLDMTSRRASAMKSAYRPRGIPVHPSLMPFVEFVERCPEGRIFHEDPTIASNRLMEHIRRLVIENVTNEDGQVEGHKQFKSWRTRFCSLLENLTTADRARYLAGHAPRDVHSRHYLEHELRDLAQAINGLADPTTESTQ